MKLKQLYEATRPYDNNTVWYHGSKVGGVTKFDPRYIGSGIVHSNSAKGFYFSTSRHAAKYFADEEYIEKESDEDWDYDDIEVYGEDDEWYFLINDINTGPYKSWDNAENAAKKIVDHHNKSNIGDVVYHDEKVNEYHLLIKNPRITDSVAEFRSAELTAVEDGYDAVIGEDILDGDTHSTVAVVFDPNIIIPI